MNRPSTMNRPSIMNRNHVPSIDSIDSRGFCRESPVQRRRSVETAILGVRVATSGAAQSHRVGWAGCLCAGFPASTFNTCTTLLLQKFCSRFSPKEVG